MFAFERAKFSSDWFFLGAGVSTAVHNSLLVTGPVGLTRA